MTTKITQMRKTIQKHAEAFGLIHYNKHSGVSGSEYLEISSEELSWKVRISDHDLPPSYAPADFEVGPHGRQPCEVIAMIADQLGKPIPAAVKGPLTRIRKAEEERQARWAAELAQLEETPAPTRYEVALQVIERAEAAGKFQTEIDEIKAWMNDLDNPSLGGSARQKRRKKIALASQKIATQLDHPDRAQLDSE